MPEPIDPTRTSDLPDPLAPADTLTGPVPSPDTSSTVALPFSASPYVELTHHAKGGLGEVLRATDPALNRTVAIKRLHDRHVANPETRRRFLVEAEVTARLEHPGVVPVYGLFADERNSPAYAMRFVQGQTFWDAIQDYHHSPSDPIAFRRLLQSFLQVCQTVAYAHSRGVIHRDLKPQNVMIGKFGETLVVDWGLAKVVGRPDDVRAQTTAEETLIPESGNDGGETAMGSAVGTPAYMSPEQAAGRWDVVGVPADVYSLGAVLYTVLTGAAPLETGNWPEQQQRIQRGDFPRPRQVKPAVPAALEAICLRAMAVEPAAHYASASDVAGDVEHWLADEPVASYRDPAGARMRRWARRNRALVRGAAVLLIAGIIGLGVGAVLLERAHRATEAQRRKAEALNRFLIDDLLKQADPANNRVGDKITVRELLDKAAEQLDGPHKLAGQPEAEADVRVVIGHAYEYLGAEDKAEKQYRRALDLRTSILGPYHRDTLSLQNRLIWILVTQDKLPEAEAMAHRSMADCRRQFGEGDPETALATRGLAEVLLVRGQVEEALPLFQSARATLRDKLGEDNEQTLEVDNGLAAALVTLGRPEEGEALFRSLFERRLRLHPRHSELVSVLNNLGAAQLGLGQYVKAEATLRDALARGKETQDPGNAGTLGTRNLIAYSLEGQGRWDEAEREYLSVLHGRQKAQGPASSYTLRTVAFLARLYAKQEKWANAMPYLAELTLAGKSDVNQTAERQAVLITDALAGKSAPSASALVLKASWDALEVRMWKRDWLTAEIKSRYGERLREDKNYSAAEPILVTAAAEVDKAAGAPAWSRAAAYGRVVDLYVAWGRPDDAAKWKAQMAALPTRESKK